AYVGSSTSEPALFDMPHVDKLPRVLPRERPCHAGCTRRRGLGGATSRRVIARRLSSSPKAATKFSLSGDFTGGCNRDHGDFYGLRNGSTLETPGANRGGVLCDERRHSSLA